jgi:micrococcal nuclease
MAPQRDVFHHGGDDMDAAGRGEANTRRPRRHPAAGESRAVVGAVVAAWLAAWSLATGAPAAGADPVRWRVVNVHDGDTLTALDHGNVQHKIRLEGIDAPELGQPFGRVSRDRLSELVKGKTATIHQHGKDRYGRVLASVELDGDDLGRRLVSEGLAWHYTRYSKDATLESAERDARSAKSGLWGDREPVPPWEWRAGEKDRRRQAVPR